MTAAPQPAASAGATDLRCEGRVDPLGIDESDLRLSWWLNDPRPGALQTGYRVRVASSPERLAEPDFWDSGRVESSSQVAIKYDGAPLIARARAWWDVTVWDANGIEAAPSAPAVFEIGLLERTDWTGSWIGTPVGEGGGTLPAAPLLHRSFELQGRVRTARLYITALGLYEPRINGLRVAEDWFRPGWTDYGSRVQYQVYDVTAALCIGSNVLAVTLGDGWYSGRIGWNDRGACYGDSPSLLAQLEMALEDGSTMTIVTDESWAWCEGPVRRQDLVDGEEYDARREVDHQSLTSHPGHAVTLRAWPSAELVAERCEPVRVIAELPARGAPVPADGGAGRAAWVFDLGQNFTGVVRLSVRGERGVPVRLRYAEMLKADGSLYTTNLRSARATDWYTLRGDEAGEIWTPTFTFHGFRYVEVSYHTRWQRQIDELDAQTVVGLALSSATERIGTFACSDARLNQLQSNIQWGQWSNFLEVPTDCPQRDERLGWTGDAQVFAATAAFNMDVDAFFRKWSYDLDDAQGSDGRLPSVVPNVLGEDDGGPGWSDARVLCAWNVYLAYGDRTILERHYQPMTEWLDWQARTSRDGVRCWDDCGYFQGYSDWLSLDGTWQSRISATPKDLIGTAYFAATSSVLARIAAVLDRAEDARRFQQYRSAAVSAFNREWVTPSGRLAVPTQTAHLMALAWDLLPDQHRPIAFERLLTLLEERGWHLSTGFLGTPLLCPVLSRFGRSDVAYRLLLDEDYPGWLFPVRNGATTMWERWNSWTPEDGFGDAAMNSFNHYAYGAVGRWMYDTIGGIRIDEQHPGYERIHISPEPDARLDWASAELRSRRGVVACRWDVDSDHILVRFRIPAGSTATVTLPGCAEELVGAGQYERRLPLLATAAEGGAAADHK